MGKRTKLIATGLAVTIGLGAGTWGLGEWQPFAYNWPSKWDPRVERLADYVERHAEFAFEHPVRTRFLPDAEFEKLVTEDEDDLTDEDREFYDATARLLRALGLATGKIDLFASQNSLNASGILAYYSPEDREMVIRMNPDDIEGDELSPALRATVVHELAHALQDQRFGLNRMRERAKDSGHNEAITVLIEGHALSIENSYVSDNFSDEERQQYDEAMQGTETPDADEIPEIMSAQQFSPYVFGPTFVEALERKGRKALLDAFLKKQPTSLEQTILPSKYFAKDKAEKVPLPKVDGKKEAVVSGQISQLDVFFLLARTVGAPEALRLSDMWGNGTYAGFETDNGGFCAALNLRGDTDEQTNELRRAFTQWSRSTNARSASVNTPVGKDYFSVRSCDPGTNVGLDVPTEIDTRQIFWRAGDISYIRRSEPDTDAECVATGIYTEFDTEALQGEPRVIDRYNELIRDCRRD